MRSVAYITAVFPTLGWFVEAEVQRLHARGVDVRVFTLRPPSREYQPQHQPLVELVESIGSPLHPAGWLALLEWTVRRPHVLVPETLRMLWASRSSGYAIAGHLAYLPAAARLARIVERDGIEWIHGGWAHFPASVAYLASRLTGRPFSMAAHAGADLYRTQAFLAEKVRAAEFVVGCVGANVEMLRSLSGRGEGVVQLYHGVDLARFDGSARARDPEPLLLTVGRLGPAKGFDDAVRALALLHARGLRARLVLVGEGPERSNLESLASSLGVRDRVEMPGSLSFERLVELYRRAWLLLAPSKVMGNGRRDGIPNVVIEAMAMGVPCVGTRGTGMEEVLVAGENGALVAPGDPEALAAAAAELLSDPARLEAVGRAARARVARDFDSASNFERLAALFENGAPAREAVERAVAIS